MPHQTKYGLRHFGRRGSSSNRKHLGSFRQLLNCFHRTFDWLYIPIFSLFSRLKITRWLFEWKASDEFKAGVKNLSSRFYLLGLIQREERRHHVRPQTIFVVPKTIVADLWIKRNEELQGDAEQRTLKW